MPESREIKVLRDMAWERAKGELKSISVTYYSEEGSNYEKYTEALETFIDQVEEEVIG